MSSTIQIFEHQKLLLGQNLSKSELDKLYEFNDKNDHKYFTGIRNGVKFKEYVGVIQIGGKTIEILPKTDNNEEGDKNLWRDVLLKMLGVCNYIHLETVSDAHLKKRLFSLLDLYFDRYLNELNKLLHRGLVKKYRTKTGNINALKGQLLFSKHIQNNLVNKQHFYTKHQTYDTEHLINQILLKALNILSKICHNVWLVDRIKTLQLLFPEIKEIAITKSHFDQVKLNRKTKDYDEALKIAKMIILNYSPDIKGGNENMIALLFNMNHLWEKYIYKMLKRDCPVEYDISEQKSKDFWETKTIRPDIVIKKGEATFIIDTKWKIIDNAEPSDADLKQMYAYNQYWNSNLSILLFPQSNNNRDKSGKFHIGKNGEHFCKLGFIQILENNQLDFKIGEKILSKLE